MLVKGKPVFNKEYENLLGRGWVQAVLVSKKKERV